MSPNNSHQPLLSVSPTQAAAPRHMFRRPSTGDLSLKNRQDNVDRAPLVLALLRAELRFRSPLPTPHSCSSLLRRALCESAGSPAPGVLATGKPLGASRQGEPTAPQYQDSESQVAY